MVKVSFAKGRKLLKVECTDPAFCTPFQPHVLADILNGVYELTQQDNKIKFEYYRTPEGEWGFRAAAKDAS